MLQYRTDATPTNGLLVCACYNSGIPGGCELVKPDLRKGETVFVR